MAKLYEYAIIKDELLDENDKVVEAADLIEKGEVLASDPAQAQILIARKIPDAQMEHLERITLAVRPF